MFISSPMRRKSWLAAATTILMLVGNLGSPAAYAKLATNTINAVARVNGPGNQLIVTGPIVFTIGETAYVRVTVTQRTTGAIAEGLARLVGTGAAQQWEIRAHAIGPQRFQPGAATAVAVAATHDGNQTTDAHQWLVNVTLVRP
jgi:F0F1-type ATP synthase membrane subunit c/vacuolar-type H+-ATPase subunit K